MKLRHALEILIAASERRMRHNQTEVKKNTYACVFLEQAFPMLLEIIEKEQRENSAEQEQ
jgi:hypothetical protein